MTFVTMSITFVPNKLFTNYKNAYRYSTLRPITPPSPSIDKTILIINRAIVIINIIFIMFNNNKTF